MGLCGQVIRLKRVGTNFIKEILVFLKLPVYRYYNFANKGNGTVILQQFLSETFCRDFT